ncbi:hypothetical protein GGP41_010172 [Bipolaris sorokiniana]|uniref:Hydrophobin n=1 Tax=Cochliobolus sativus TaxID=45130 RepID=A0A8H5Z7P7_COCSA|nr:hypothetical protein GGP41_010172 [Bipolaris sorokiniana]
MYASTIVLALGGTASILAAPVAESPVAQAAALAVLLGSCSIWGGIYGGEGSSSCCVYSGGPATCCNKDVPVSKYNPETNQTLQVLISLL